MPMKIDWGELIAGIIVGIIVTLCIVLPVYTGILKHENHMYSRKDHTAYPEENGISIVAQDSIAVRGDDAVKEAVFAYFEKRTQQNLDSTNNTR